ncbi:MAG: glycosyltransferase family 4 protein [candidate division Zixibacteria bacterium]|nr:glycosyltransferase family 4 protein [candidate division Zixibacteria bacterium]
MHKVLFLDTEHKRFSSEFFDELSLKVPEIHIIKMKTSPFHLNYGRTFFYKVVQVWMPFLLFAIRGFAKGRRYDIVICWSGVVGLFMGFLKLIFFRTKPKLFVVTFIFRPRKSKIITALRFWFYKVCIRKIDGIICHSRDEADYYANLFGLDRKKIKFVPYGIELPKIDLQENGKELYVASAGKSNRDYELVQKATKGLEMKVKIYCSRDYNILTKVDKESNLEVCVDTPLKEFLQGLHNALFVIIPLKVPEFSSGQLVLLQAMALSKTVVATDCWGTKDYLKNMENGILVTPGDASDLREKILFLQNNPSELRRMGENAQKSVQQYFNIRAFAANIGTFIRERMC